jgi:rhodanese-related sulfurtransferase
MNLMTCEQLQTEVENGAILLDVRTEGEYRQARLPNSVLIPLNELQRVHSEIDTNKEVLVYCRSGNRSGTAANALHQWGYNAKNIGGVMHYMQCIEY